MKRTIEILMMPIRIFLNLAVFAPILLLLALTEKIGEWLTEGSEVLSGMVYGLSKHCQFLLNCKLWDEAKELKRKNLQLAEMIAILREQIDGKDGGQTTKPSSVFGAMASSDYTKKHGLP